MVLKDTYIYDNLIKKNRHIRYVYNKGFEKQGV